MWIIGQGCQFLVCAKDKQMVLLRIAVLVVDFLAGYYKDAFLSFPIIGIHPLHQDIVVGDQEHIHAGFKGRLPSSAYVRSHPSR